MSLLDKMIGVFSRTALSTTKIIPQKDGDQSLQITKADGITPILTIDTVNNKVKATTFNGDLVGNSATASKWETPRTLTFNGDIAGNGSIDGSNDLNITVTATKSSGGFSVGGNLSVTGTSTFTGTITAPGGVTGNASTASKLATARTMALAGDVSGSANFDGSANLTINAIVADDSHLHDTRYYTKSEVADLIETAKEGLDPKESCRVATTANITLSGIQTIDGVTLVAGDRVLVKDQTTASQNGIYVVASGSWARATDADTSQKVTANMFTFIAEGTNNADTGWLLVTNDIITLGTTSLTFTQFSGAGMLNAGTGLVKNGNTLSLANVGTAGTYKSVTVDATGRVISGSNPTTLNGYGITDALSITGNAASASKLNTARTINGISFDGSSNITITAAANGGTSATCSGNAATATKLATARTINGVSFDGSANITVADSTKAPTNHASTDTTYGVSSATNYGHVKASSVTPLAAGTAAVGTDDGTYARGGHVHPAQTSVSGNAGTASKLATARIISMTGDVIGSGSFDGSGNLTIETTCNIGGSGNNNGARIGDIKIIAYSTPEPGWQECDNGSLAVADYPELFAKIGYTFGGSGDYFKKPPTRGLFIRGFDNGAGVDPGRVFGSVQEDALQKFNLSSEGRTSAGATVDEVYTSYLGYGWNAGQIGTATDPTIVRAAPNSSYKAIVPVNANVDTETRPKNVAFMLVIKVLNIVAIDENVETNATTLGGIPASSYLRAVDNTSAVGFNNLKIVATGNSVRVTFDSAVLKTPTNVPRLIPSKIIQVSGTESIISNFESGTTLSMETWCSIWVIYNPTTDVTRLLFSTSSTNPILPSGFTYYARCGWFDAINNYGIYPFRQYGNVAQYEVDNTYLLGPRVMAYGVLGSGGFSNPTLVGVNTSIVIPPTASQIHIGLHNSYKGQACSAMLIAPNNNYKGPTNSNGNMAFGVLNNAYTESWTDYMILESTQIYIFSSNAGGAVVCYGWVDNL